MNAQRLAEIANILTVEFGNTTVVDRLTRLTSLTRDAINSPNEQNQRNVEAALKDLSTALASAETTKLSPALRADLDELSVGGVRAEELVGEGLLTQLTDIYANGATTVQTLDRLTALSKTVSSLQTAIEQIRTGLVGVGLKADKLREGEAVVGMTVPRTEVDGGFRELRDELAFFGRLVGDLSECVAGEREEPQVRSLRSSDFGIDLSASIDVTSVLATVIKGLKAAFDKLKKFRDLKQQAADLGLEDSLVEQLASKATESMENARDEILVDVMQHCTVSDDGRRNELKTAIRLDINGLANRLDRGFSFEVRTGPPPAGAGEDLKAMAANVATLTTIRFERLDGPRLFGLPEEASDESTAEGAPSKRHSRRPRKG